MYQNRIEKLRTLMLEQNVDAFLVTNHFNIIYLTGYETLAPHEREVFVLVTQGKVYVFSDGRYQEDIQLLISNNQSISHKPIFKLLTSQKGLFRHLREIIDGEKIRKLGFEREDLKWSEYETIKNNVIATLLPLDKTIIQFRAVKEEIEIENIEKACRVGDQALSELIPHLSIGKSEKELAFLFETIVRGKGDEVSFDSIVAVNTNSSLPHYNTKNGREVIKNGSVVLIDCGVNHKGYCSDITRIFFVGNVPEIMKKKYMGLKQVQQNTIDQIKKDMAFSEIDLYCRKRMTDEGLLDYPHSTGHGVGLEIHEFPKVSTFSADKVTANNVFTIEPGIYFPGQWGMRIEDTVYLDHKGCCVVLTQFSKEIVLL